MALHKKADSGEVTTGTETKIRSFSPADLKLAAETFAMTKAVYDPRNLSHITGASPGASVGGYLNIDGHAGGGDGGEITAVGSGAFDSGDINVSGGSTGNGGNINTEGGAAGAGGNINTSDGGGAINTSYLGVGFIELGASGTRTTLIGTATANRTINLPDAAGTLALTTGVGLPEVLEYACSDESTAITAGTGKLTFRMPFACILTAVRASVITAPTGATLIIDINEAGVSVLSTPLSIDATEKTSVTAASAAVISDSALADDAEMTIDFDQVGATIAGAGVKVKLYVTRL